ncbi:hypothetical protein [Paractinoplanes hotanensis]|uniref:Methyltransferase domain-containing protein n=1 Tax=Paractinoplanes hotanensis TaxID=2906497 RepID=A0ABT0YEJ5_9ACTN|nr:hypothetical protein [Actinoplanes hotanensis]MCM4083957.1 hypothetical protein [Actinoplanes hotanensis]
MAARSERHATARLVDFGCGYGRITGIAEQLGFTNAAVCRHHSVEWLLELLRDRFTVNATRELDVVTMNSNTARAMQILAARS